MHFKDRRKYQRILIRFITFVDTYKMSRKMERKAMYISTSENEQLQQLSCPSPVQLKKRLIIKSRFFDDTHEDTDSDDNSK